MSYTIDIYRGRLEPRRSFIEFALFVSFFPQLVAGPIVRARQFLPQLDRAPAPSERCTAAGLYLVLKGLVKKVFIADLLGRLLVDPVFAGPAGYGALWGLLAVYAFKFQIYNDFSGYSDVAIGCGRLLGYELPVNFRSPYKSRSITEYWQRWHITLGAWFRDYLFFPLGGTRRGEFRTQLNLLLVMGLVGLWHGAKWTFVIWGLYYGVLMCLARIRKAWFGREVKEVSALGGVARVLLVFNLTALAAVFFRAPDLLTVRQLAGASWQTAAGPLPNSEKRHAAALSARPLVRLCPALQACSSRRAGTRPAPCTAIPRTRSAQRLASSVSLS
jgi:D-alanyl-lipoteichoic acid acyltransferase DltB (MBOAT superfamily)